MEERLQQTLELVRRAQAGDGVALNELVGRYYERVRQSVRSRLGPALRARLDSGDILQQTFAKACENFDRFDMRAENSLLRWLAQYAERQIQDELRRARSIKRLPPAGQQSLDGDADDSATPAPVSGRETGPLGHALANERRRLLHDCLQELPAHYRQVLDLRDRDDLSWRDIAERLGKDTESAARELHSRAKAALTKAAQRRGLAPDAGDDTDAGAARP